MKIITCIAVLATAIVVPSAEAGNAVWNNTAGDSNWQNPTNWFLYPSTTPYTPLPADHLFFRGDHFFANPSVTNVVLSSSAATSSIKFQGSIDSSAAYHISASSGGSLTIDGHPAGSTQLIQVFDAVMFEQRISADLVLSSINNANNQHVITGTGAGLVLSGTVSQAAGSSGLGIFVGNGDVEISGNVSADNKLWKIHNGPGGAGVFKLTGTGVWSGFGTVQINSGVEVLLNRSTTNSTAFAPGVLQVQGGGTLSLGNDEQVLDTLDLTLGDNSAFKLDGHTETIRGLNFLNAANAAVVDMGSGGILHMANQNSTAIWGALTIRNWVSGVDHIYVDGGSFSAAQLAAITFDEWEPAGAKVEGGELLPVGTTSSAYETWATDFGVGIETDDDDHDGLINVYEYGLGGDPTNALDQGISPVYAVDGGILTYIHPQLSDAGHGLDYHLELTDNLTTGSWTNAGYTVIGTNMPGGDFDYVTNSITMDIDQEFIQLIIDTL